MQVVVTKPGAIDGPGREETMNAMAKALYSMYGYVPKVHVSELAAASIELCLKGSTKEPLWSEDLVELGGGLLDEEDYLR